MFCQTDGGSNLAPEKKFRLTRATTICGAYIEAYKLFCVCLKKNQKNYAAHTEKTERAERNYLKLTGVFMEKQNENR